MSGGTDVCTAFVGGVPTLPVYEGELQARSLGAKVEAFDERGQPLIGEVGELVLTEPLPSMPIYLWNDPDGSATARATSRSTRACGATATGSRSPRAARRSSTAAPTRRSTGAAFGSARARSTAPFSRWTRSPTRWSSTCREGTDGWMSLFVVLREGVELSDELADEIRRRVREDCSPRHVPDEIRAVPAIPRTLSGKILEVPVKRILMGVPPEQAASRDSLANPEALDYFVDLAHTV